MLVEAKQAFYNEETGAVQPWRDIEVEDTLGNELVNEGLAAAIAAGGGGGGDFTVVEMTFALGDGVTAAYIYGTFIFDYGLETEYSAADLYVTSSTTLHTVMYKGVGHITSEPGYWFDGENISEAGGFTDGGTVTINQGSD